MKYKYKGNVGFDEYTIIATHAQIVREYRENEEGILPEGSMIRWIDLKDMITDKGSTTSKS